jgi:hypothetical protein
MIVGFAIDANRKHKNTPKYGISSGLTARDCQPHGAQKSLTREIIWHGHDRPFVEAMTSELGILLDPETAIVAIVRLDQSVLTYVVDDGTTALSLVARSNRVEVRREAGGSPGEPVVELDEVRGSRVKLHCQALVSRIQVREMDTASVNDDQRPSVQSD